MPISGQIHVHPVCQKAIAEQDTGEGFLISRLVPDDGHIIECYIDPE